MFRRILAPTDFSETAEAALQCAKDLALQHGSTLQVLHVIEDQGLHGVGRGPGLDKQVAAAREWMERRLTADEAGRVKADVQVVTGYPAFAIPRYALNGGFDLIVMGTHGRGDTAHAGWGSVAEKVVGSSPCPVLTLRHQKHQKILADRLAQSGLAGETS